MIGIITLNSHQLMMFFKKRVQINIETSLCMIGIITLNSQYIVVIKEVVIRSPFCKFTLFRQHFNDQKLQSYIHHSRATECLQSNSEEEIMQFLFIFDFHFQCTTKICPYQLFHSYLMKYCVLTISICSTIPEIIYIGI